MAEPTNPGQPSDSSTERGSPVNVETSGNVTVTRKDVATGDVKDNQAKLLEELCKCIDKQTATLGSAIKGVKDEIVNAVGGGGGGGSGSGGGGGGGKSDENKKKQAASAEHAETIKALEKIADEITAVIAKPTGGGGEGGDSVAGDSAIGARAHMKSYEVLSDVMDSTSLEFKQWGKLFGAGATIEMTKNIGNINKSLFDFGQSLTDINAAWRKASAEGISIMEMGQGGMIDVTSLFTDLGSSILSNRDALRESAKTVIEFRDQGQLLIGTLGTNLEEVSQALKRNRDAVDDAFGDDFLGAIPFEQQNEILTNILDVERRTGNVADQQTILSSRSTRTQLDYLKDISFQTGQTVAEVMKLYKEEAKTFNELEGLGLLQAGEGKTTARNAQKLNAAGQGNLVEMLTSIIEAGSIEQWMGKSDSNAAFGSVPGNIEAMNTALAGFKSGTNVGADAAVNAARSFSTVGSGSQQSAGGLFEAFPELRKFMGAKIDAQGRSQASFDDVGEARAEQAETIIKGGIGGQIAETYNDIKEFLANNFGAGGDLLVAIAGNVLALWANTAAQAGGAVLGGGGGKGGIMNKVKTMGKTAMTAGGTALGGITAAGTAAAAAAALGIWQGGQAVTSAFSEGGSRSDINDGLNYIAPDVMRSLGDAIFGGADRLLAFAGVDSAEARVKAQDDFTNMKIAEANGTLGRQGGVSPDKGVNPLTRGDVAAVAPAGVTSSESIKAPKTDPFMMEMMKHTAQFESMIVLMTAGNTARQSLLDIGNNRISPEGKPSWLGTPFRNQSEGDAYTKLLDESPA